MTEKNKNKQEQRKTGKQNTCTKKGTNGVESTFTEQEIKLFKRRFENGYDLKSDRRYNLWLKNKRRWLNR